MNEETPCEACEKRNTNQLSAANAVVWHLWCLADREGMNGGLVPSSVFRLAEWYGLTLRDAERALNLEATLQAEKKKDEPDRE